jgi:IS5 family transposase
VNDCNERIVRHGLNVIDSSAATDHDDDSSHGGGAACPADQQIGSNTIRPSRGSLLIDVTCVPADIRHPTDLSLLNEARELTETLIDAMYSQARDAFGHKPPTHRKQSRQQFLAVAKKKMPRINKIRKAIRQQLGHLRRNLACIDDLTGCGASLLAAGRYAYQQLLVVSELVR